MTVDELIEELKQISTQGHGDKEVRKYMPDEPRYEENAFPIRSVCYISLRHYGSDFVEIV